MPEAPPPSPQFQNLFGKTRAQGARFDTLTPPADGSFYGFLSKADFDADTQKWDVLFEVVNSGWMENVIFGRSISISARTPTVPALLYHVQAVDEATLLKALGLTSTDYLAEGSWYQMKLSPGGKGAVTGDLYDPDIDTVPGNVPPEGDTPRRG
ncbi:MAG: hypothetical protein QOF69_3890 [Solirubrobacteraceae bacterium]|nr:hypothetical protein [Solirubrobacteraceae bacterium]